MGEQPRLVPGGSEVVSRWKRRRQGSLLLPDPLVSTLGLLSCLRAGSALVDQMGTGGCKAGGDVLCELRISDRSICGKRFRLLNGTYASVKTE